MIQIETWRGDAKEAIREVQFALTPNLDRGEASSHLYNALIEIVEALQKLGVRDDD